MAVTVIAPPKPEDLHKIVCSNCASTLQYAKVDIKTRKVSCMGDVDIENYITCPSCKYKQGVKQYPLN